MSPWAPRPRGGRVLTAAAGAIALWALSALVGGPRVAVADNLCGSGRPCPHILQISPTLVDPVPTGPLEVTLSGSGLGNIGGATLLPPATPVSVTSSADARLVVVVPEGTLQPGQAYRIQVSVGSGPLDTVASPAFSVVDPTSAGSSVALVPAPPITPRPSIAPATKPPVSTAPAPGGTSLAGGILVALLGFAVAGGVLFLVAVKTGLIAELRGPRPSPVRDSLPSPDSDAWWSDQAATDELLAQLETTGAARHEAAPLTPQTDQPAPPAWAFVPPPPPDDLDAQLEAALQRQRASASMAVGAHSTQPVTSTAPPPAPTWSIRPQAKPEGPPQRRMPLR